MMVSVVAHYVRWRQTEDDSLVRDDVLYKVDGLLQVGKERQIVVQVTGVVPEHGEPIAVVNVSW
jgi:hypothetical protein